MTDPGGQRLSVPTSGPKAVATPASDWSGPWLRAAVFCERVLNETDGVQTLVRIVDRIFTITQTFDAKGPVDSVPEGAAIQEVRFPLRLMLFLSWIAGDYVGDASQRDARVHVVARDPNGGETPVLDARIAFVAGKAGVGLRVEMGMVLEHLGTYWFDVLLNDRLQTRLPLEVAERDSTSQPAGS